MRKNTPYRKRQKFFTTEKPVDVANLNNSFVIGLNKLQISTLNLQLVPL